MLLPQYYYPVFLYSIILMSVFQFFELQNLTQKQLLSLKKRVGMYVYCIAFIIIVGMRPISGYFGDTINYAQYYYAYQRGLAIYDSDSSEWLFNWLMAMSSQVMDVHGFFLIIEILYIIPMLLACKHLCPQNTSLSMLFCMGAFSFFTYGTNGIRNGMACSLIILAFTYINGTTKDKFITAILCFCAYHVHHSTALPILCMLISYFYKNTRVVLTFWILSILISLVAGAFLENFFAGLGFDDRLNDYITNDEFDDQFSSTGFRWDFLLYSFMPILLGYYLVVKRNIYDSNYLLLLHTYILCNSFWVMLIRASFSNRFAYLSWFMYPIVLAYPLLKLPIWNAQGKKTGFILLGHTMFTYLMWLIKG